jgi:hypothetical protein
MKKLEPKFVQNTTQRHVIDFYKVLIEGTLPEEYYQTINALIIRRWSVRGLEKIKNTAWKELEKENPAKYKWR